MAAPTGQWADAAVEATRQFMTTANRLPTIFDLDDASYAMLAALEKIDDPEKAAEIEAQLELIDQLLLTKVEGYVSVIREFEKMADKRKDEADRMRDRAKTAQRHADWLRNRLLVHMQSTDRARVETAKFTITRRQNPPSVNVQDAGAVPSTFNRTKIIVEVDKRSILDNFRTTGEIPSGVEITRGERLDIS